MTFHAPAAVADDRVVARRHVFYLCGYDPTGPRKYHRVFVRNLAAFAALWDVEQATASACDAPDGAVSATWTVTTRSGGRTVETVYEFLRWDDLVAADFQTPLADKVGRGLVTLWDALASGTLAKMFAIAPRFALAWLYPYVAQLLAVAIGYGVGAFASDAVSGGAGGAALGAAAGVAAAFGALHLMRLAGSYAVHLLDDWNAQRRYRRRADPALDGRLDAFAARLRAVAKADAVDEILVVGHSSGSILAIDVVARALALDQTLCRRGPAISLLTVGVCELLVAFHPKAGWFRDRIARLAGETRLFWAEVAGSWDVLNVSRTDCVTALGLRTHPGENPHFRKIKLRRMLGEPTIRRIILRLRAFRLHFQFVFANERRGPYDYYALLCGTRTARAQFLLGAKEPMAPFPAAGGAPSAVCAPFAAGVTLGPSTREEQPPQ